MNSNGRRSAWPPNFEGRFANVDGNPVYYVESIEESPDNPPVVLVHGLGLSHRYLMPAAILLAPDFKVLVPNLPGFGKSYKPDEILDVEDLADALDRWMEAIDLPSAAFLGNSMGCQVIIALATRHPDRVSRAVLQGPTYDPAGGGVWGQTIRWQCNVIQESYDSERSIAEIAYDEAGRWRVVRTFYLALKKHHPEQSLPGMECPTLVIRGSEDPIVSQDWVETMVRLLPDGQLVVLPGLSHTLNWAAPFDLVSVAAPFLTELGRALVCSRPYVHGPAPAMVFNARERDALVQGAGGAVRSASPVCAEEPGVVRSFRDAW